MSNLRGYTWLDESIEHSEQDTARADTLARRWSEIHNEDEWRGWAAQADREEGRDYEPELDECSTCEGLSLLGYVHPKKGWPHEMGCSQYLYGIKCPNPTCEDGYEMGPLREAQARQKAADEDRALEVELIEDKLAAIGARMMRPYEHHNEDERYMEYMEVGRFAGEDY